MLKGGACFISNARGIWASGANGKILSKAVTLNPEYIAAYNYWGLAEAAVGNYEGALVHYDRALSLDPKYAPAHVRRGGGLD